MQLNTGLHLKHPVRSMQDDLAAFIDLPGKLPHIFKGNATLEMETSITPAKERRIFNENCLEYRSTAAIFFS
jgi:hypothetical protein